MCHVCCYWFLPISFLSLQKIFLQMTSFMTKGTLISCYIFASRFELRIISTVFFSSIVFSLGNKVSNNALSECLSLFRIFVLVNAMQTSLRTITLLPYNKVVTNWLYYFRSECNRIIALTSSLISSSKFFKYASNFLNLEI